MRRLLRSLEKKLVVERTELAVVPLVHDLLSRWEDALSDDRQTPDVLDFVAGLIESGFCLTTGSKAFSYLDRCQGKGSLPDKGRLLQILMPWYVPDSLMGPIATVTPDVPALIAKEESPPRHRGQGSPGLALGAKQPRVRRAAPFAGPQNDVWGGRVGKSTGLRPVLEGQRQSGKDLV